jgi:hypothetical protein
MVRGKEIKIYRSGFLNMASSIEALIDKYEILSAVNNDGDWIIIIKRR